MRFAARFFSLYLTIAGFYSLLAGCVHPSSTVRPAVRAPGPHTVGKVAIVNQEQRFVLIDLDPYLYVPAAGTELRSSNGKAVTAHLRASTEQKRPFIAADIVDGDPAVGDEVVR